MQEAGAELGDFPGGAGFFVGDGVGAFEIRKQRGFGVGGEIVNVNAADVVVAGMIGSARQGFLDAAAGSVDGGGPEDEGRPGSGGDALLGFQAGAGAFRIGIDGSGGVYLRGASVDGGGGKVNSACGGRAEGVEQIGGFGGGNRMKHENPGARVRGEIVECDDVRAELGERCKSGGSARGRGDLVAAREKSAGHALPGEAAAEDQDVVHAYTLNYALGLDICGDARARRVSDILSRRCSDPAKSLPGVPSGGGNRSHAAGHLS